MNPWLVEATSAAAVVHTAEELGLLERLEEGPLDPAAVELPERTTAVLLEALRVVGLAESAGDRWHATPLLGPLRPSLRHWSRLSDAARGEPLVLADEESGARALYPAVVPFLATLFADAARAFATRVGPAGRVLDVGAGAAPWSRALAGADVTALDLPGVIEVTRAATGFRCIAGDVFTADLGGPYDLVVAGNLCHLFSPDRNEALLARLHRALVPGGRLAIVDVIPDGPPTRAAALYAVGLLLRTREGRAYPWETYRRWLETAGFRGAERSTLSDTPAMDLVISSRSS